MYVCVHMRRLLWNYPVLCIIRSLCGRFGKRFSFEWPWKCSSSLVALHSLTEKKRNLSRIFPSQFPIFRLSTTNLFSISLLTCLHAWLRRIFIHTLFRFRSNFQALLPMLLSAYQNLLLNHAQCPRNYLPSWWTYANDTAVTMAATTLT